MEHHHQSTLTRALGPLIGRRSVLSALIGTSTGLAFGESSAADTDQEMPAPFLEDPPSPVPVNLVAKIAGEDLVNDWIKVVSEPGMLTTHAQQGEAIEPGGTNASLAIDSSRFRSYAAMAYGAEGPISIHLEISPDAETWFWHPDGESPAIQHPVQKGILVAPHCRVAVVNRHTATQSVQSWVVLAR